MFFQTILGTVVTLVVYLLLSKQAKRNHIKRQEFLRGCSPCPVMPKTGFLGFGRLIDGMKANNAERGPQYVVETMDEAMGKDVHTCIVPIHDYELIVTRDPRNVQAVLAGNATDWDVSEHRAASWRPMIGHGIFTSRGQDWKHSRALVRPLFNKQQTNDLDLFERHVHHLFSVIDREYRGGSDEGWTKKFDLLPLCYNMALDVVTEMIYGRSVHSQNPSARRRFPIVHGLESPDTIDIGTHMDAGKLWIETRGALWKYRWLLPTGTFYKHCAAIHKYAEWFVQFRLRTGQRYLRALSGGKDSKHRYVLLNELAKVTEDPVELRSQTLNVFVAGRDTTASLIGWIVYFLARHPGVLAELRDEVLGQFGPYIPNQPSGIKFKEFRGTYLNAVINEVLRFAPVVPLNERVSVCDTVLPRGGGLDGERPIFIPKGTQILLPTYALARRTDLWGPDADEFRPARWLEDGGRKFGFEFVPFGGGVRQCMGRKYSSRW